MAEEEPKPVPSKGWAAMIRKVYEVDPMVCPKCGGTMKVIAFITEYAVVGRIIDHLKLTFVADKPPPSHVFTEVALMEAEESGSLFSFSRCGGISCPDRIRGRDCRGD